MVSGDFGSQSPYKEGVIEVGYVVILFIFLLYLLFYSQSQTQISHFKQQNYRKYVTACMVFLKKIRTYCL